MKCNYVYKVRHHAIPSSERSRFQPALDMLMSAVACDEPVDLAVGDERQVLPADLALLVLEALVHMLDHDKTAVVMLAAHERLTVSRTAELLGVARENVGKRVDRLGLREARLNDAGYHFYDQTKVLAAFSGRSAVETGD